MCPLSTTLVCYNRSNFGDQLAEVVVRSLLGSDVQVCNMAVKGTERAGKGLVGLGSVLHFAGPDDTIWGTGVIPGRFRWQDLQWFSRLRRRIAPSWDVRAVRGPLTREFMVRKLGIDCPEVYGDPALLLPEIVGAKARAPRRRYGVVPHYRDLPLLTGEPVMSPLSPWQDVLTFILESELVVASSLHALIVAEAFGVPARWLHSDQLPSAKSEGSFKYQDYYLSTGRRGAAARSVAEALRLGGAEVPQLPSRSRLRGCLSP